MENLVPRLVGKIEARQLGVQGGWYGAKVSGTFMTGPCASLAACIEAIDLMSEPPKVVLNSSETVTPRALPVSTPPADFFEV